MREIQARRRKFHAAENKPLRDQRIHRCHGLCPGVDGFLASSGLMKSGSGGDGISAWLPSHL
jgi:hypothetical protein